MKPRLAQFRFYYAQAQHNLIFVLRLTIRLCHSQELARFITVNERKMFRQVVFYKKFK